MCVSLMSAWLGPARPRLFALVRTSAWPCPGRPRLGSALTEGAYKEWVAAIREVLERNSDAAAAYERKAAELAAQQQAQQQAQAAAAAAAAAAASAAASAASASPAMPKPPSGPAPPPLPGSPSSASASSSTSSAGGGLASPQADGGPKARSWMRQVCRSVCRVRVRVSVRAEAQGSKFCVAVSLTAPMLVVLLCPLPHLCVSVCFPSFLPIRTRLPRSWVRW